MAGSFRPRSMIKAYTLDADPAASISQTYGAGRSRLYVVGPFDSAAVEAAIRKAFAGWDKGAAPAQPPAKPTSTRAVHIVDRPGAPQSTVILGVPTVDPSNRGLHPADRDGCAARRRLRLPHHQEHPRGQGLYLLALQRALGPISRRLLGGERRCHDDGDRAVDQGDPVRRSIGCRPSRPPRRS